MVSALFPDEWSDRQLVELRAVIGKMDYRMLPDMVLDQVTGGAADVLTALVAALHGGGHLAHRTREALGLSAGEDDG
jgi:hypothetical protein